MRLWMVLSEMHQTFEKSFIKVDSIIVSKAEQIQTKTEASRKLNERE